MPKRIQRKRTKGWRMPEGAVYVGRPTQWGNPYRSGELSRERCIELYRYEIVQLNGGIVGFNRFWVQQHLRGKDLACWCPLSRPCHADVLLELANAGGDGDDIGGLAPRFGRSGRRGARAVETGDRAMSEDLRQRVRELAEEAKLIFVGFENESLNGVVCSIPDSGLETKPHRTWCARCQRLYQRLKALAENLSDAASLLDGEGITQEQERRTSPDYRNAPWEDDDLPMPERLRRAAEYIAQFDGCWLGHTDCVCLTELLREASGTVQPCAVKQRHPVGYVIECEKPVGHIGDHGAFLGCVDEYAWGGDQETEP